MLIGRNAAVARLAKLRIPELTLVSEDMSNEHNAAVARLAKLRIPELTLVRNSAFFKSARNWQI